MKRVSRGGAREKEREREREREKERGRAYERRPDKEEEWNRIDYGKNAMFVKHEFVLMWDNFIQYSTTVR